VIRKTSSKLPPANLSRRVGKLSNGSISSQTAYQRPGWLPPVEEQTTKADVDRGQRRERTKTVVSNQTSFINTDVVIRSMPKPFV